jgi:hypothetical protein
MKANQLVWQLWFNYCGFTVFFIFKKFYFGVIVGYWSDTIRQAFFLTLSVICFKMKIRKQIQYAYWPGPQVQKALKLQGCLNWRWVCWDIAPCSLIGVDRRFRGAYCLHQGDDGVSEHIWIVGLLRDTRRYISQKDGISILSAVITSSLTMSKFL